MKNKFIATIVAAAMLFSGLAVFGQQVDVTQLTANGDWAVAPDSSGVVVSTAENGFAEYLIEVNTEHGYSSATVSVTNSGYFVDEFGDSAAFLVVPHVLQREHELAFAIRLVSADSNELIDINSTSSSASQTWLDEYLVWVTQALGDGWSELDVEIENFVGVDGGDIYNASATGEAAYQPISFGNDDDEELPWYHLESIGRWFFGSIGLGGVEKNIESNKNRLNNLENGPLKAGGNFHVDSTTKHTLETTAKGYIEYFAAGGGMGVTKRGIGRRAPKRNVSISPQRRTHILDGDRTGGGHRPGLGKPGKSEFPEVMTDDQIIDTITDVASDPTSVTRPGRGGRTIVEGTRDGIDILVVLESDGSIVTGFPTNVPLNPRR